MEWTFDAPFTKAYKIVNKAGEQSLHVVAVASDSLKDLTGDRISEDAIASITDQANKEHHDVLTNHFDSFAIGRIFEAENQRIKKGSRFLVDLELFDRFPQSVELWKDVKSGEGSKQLSIAGRINLDNEDAILWEEDSKGNIVRVINDLELDHIAVTRKGLAANPRTGFRNALLKSLNLKDGTEFAEKTVITFRSHPKNDESSWSFSASDGNKLIDRGGFKLFKSAHTWFDSENPDVKGSFKLPHHKIDSDGTFKTFRRGVIAASGAFAGARGGVRLPPVDRPGVASHLRRHFKEFDMEPPESLKSIKGNEDFIFEKDIFIKFFKDQGVDMEWFSEWLNQGEIEMAEVDKKLEDEKIEDKKEDKKVEKTEDKKTETENKDAEAKKTEDKKTEDKVEKDNEPSREEKLVVVIKSIVDKMREVHKSDDGEVSKEQIENIKKCQEIISEFLKEINASDKTEEDEDDNIDEQLNSLKESTEKTIGKLSDSVLKAVSVLNDKIEKIAKSSSSKRLKSDEDDDEDDDEGNVFKGLIRQTIMGTSAKSEE